MQCGSGPGQINSSLHHESPGEHKLSGMAKDPVIQYTLSGHNILWDLWFSYKSSLGPVLSLEDALAPCPSESTCTGQAGKDICLFLPCKPQVFSMIPGTKYMLALGSSHNLTQ
jgi:hypothetical protein